MARYIDADNLVERLKVSPIFQDFGTDGYFIRDMVIDLVGCRPTADVVPKSEVEELKAIIADHKANEERWQELYADTVNKWEEAYEKLEIQLDNAKSEVAREIFEEIDKAHEDCIIILGDMGYLQPFKFEQKIAELKKKYTEEKE